MAEESQAKYTGERKLEFGGEVQTDLKSELVVALEALARIYTKSIKR